MAYLQQICTLRSRRELAPGVWDFIVDCPPLARQAQPGQFVHVRVAGCYLRRPISICEADAMAGTIRLVFEVRGAGTEQLAKLPQGGEIDLIGPLGKGFSLPGTDRKLIVVGGGIGVPPLLWLAATHQQNVTAILGFRNRSAVILAEDFLAYGSDVRIATDDGSMGHQGLVTELLEARLREDSTKLVCACGPMAMLQKTAALSAAMRVPCEVSLEERMGCGVGACLVCACKTVKTGTELFSHVCKDGPVFQAEEVVWR